jgi:hypothetical protein
MGEPRNDWPVADGAVDTSLIEEMLRLAPADRLRLNDRMAALATKLREAFSRREGRWPNHAS